MFVGGDNMNTLAALLARLGVLWTEGFSQSCSESLAPFTKLNVSLKILYVSIHVHSGFAVTLSFGQCWCLSYANKFEASLLTKASLIDSWKWFCQCCWQAKYYTWKVNGLTWEPTLYSVVRLNWKIKTKLNNNIKLSLYYRLRISEYLNNTQLSQRLWGRFWNLSSIEKQKYINILWSVYNANLAL